MSIVYHERPGVYSDYEASSVASVSAGSRVIGIAAKATATAGLYAVSSYSAAVAAFGEDSELGRMCRLLYLNGAGTVLAYPVTKDGDYETALGALTAEKRAGLLVVGSDTLSVHQALQTAVRAASKARCECIGLCGMKDATAEQLIARAAALNDERMVLVGPDFYLPGIELCQGGCMGAAALAGVLAAQTDPALPLGGAVLSGFAGVSARYDENTLDELILGGVTVIEADGTQPAVIRGVTTRTKTGGAADATWRELNTTLIIDEVIPSIRTALRSRFTRAKNSAATRSAIRTQVQVELESRVEREIIDGYDAITVEPDASDPTVCQVSFGFTVTHGLSRIYLTAHISV